MSRRNSTFLGSLLYRSGLAGKYCSDSEAAIGSRDSVFCKQSFDKATHMMLLVLTTTTITTTNKLDNRKGFCWPSENHFKLGIFVKTFPVGPLRKVRAYQKSLINAGSEGTSIEYCNSTLSNTIPRIYLYSLLDLERLLDILSHA
uniref:Uncharacterized protein n=1 Tax=Glossina austeni TaxID=7395 RepID=A0A1A9UTM7_GLOAU